MRLRRARSATPTAAGGRAFSDLRRRPTSRASFSTLPTLAPPSVHLLRREEPLDGVRTEAPEAALRREVTSLSDDLSAVRAATESRARKLESLRLELEHATRVHDASSEGAATGTAAVSAAQTAAASAERDAFVLETRASTWRALRERTAAERLRAQQTAETARREMDAAEKESLELRAGCERASRLAAEATRRFEAARAEEDVKAAERRLDREQFGAIRASLAVDPARAAAIMMDVRRRRRANRSTDGVRPTTGAPGAAEAAAAAAGEKILVETGVGSAEEVVRRMCGGQDALEAELRARVTDEERRVRALKRALREETKRRDEATMNETAAEAEAAARERRAVEAAAATLEAAGAAMKDAKGRTARAVARAARAALGVDGLLATLAAADVEGVEGAAREEEEEEEDGDGDEAAAVARRLRALERTLDRVLSAAAPGSSDPTVGFSPRLVGVFPKMLVGSDLGAEKENDRPGNTRRVTLCDFYRGVGADSSASPSAPKKGAGVSDAHRAARLDIRRREGATRKAAKNKTGPDRAGTQRTLRSKRLAVFDDDEDDSDSSGAEEEEVTVQTERLSPGKKSVSGKGVKGETRRSRLALVR